VGGFIQTMQKLGPMRLAAIGGVLLVLVAFFIFLTTRLTTPSLGLLYSELEMKDSAEVVQKLEGMNIPYQLKGDGTQIMVPSDQVARLRIMMAEAGIPHGNSVGYEIFDKPEGLGTTNFLQNINQIRALEGELARTISSISAVQAARVHLVLPQRELFSRDKQEPSASVVLKLRGSDRLSKGQISAVQHLVATAVPGLTPSRISIVDQSGNLLASGGDKPDDPMASINNADEKRTAYQNRVARSIEEMLERTLGYGKVRAEVNADMDFDRVTTNSESYDPNGQVVRSTQTVNEQNENTDPGDQPISVATNLPEGQQVQGQGGAGKAKSSRAEETVNYEITKTTKSQVRESGMVRRISVAVLVDGLYIPGTDGQRAYQPRSPEEIEQLKTLVRSAIGFDAKRGDTVEVVNLRFTGIEEPINPDAPILLGMTKADLFRVVETLVLAIVAVLVILLVIRPLVMRAMDAAKEGGAHHGMLTDQSMGGFGMAGIGGMGPNGVPLLAGQSGGMDQLGYNGPGGSGTGTALATTGESEETMIDLGQVEGRVRASSIKKIGEIVDKHPEEAVAILRSWMYQGA